MTAHPLFGFFLAFIGTALFSFKSIFIKLAYAQGLETNSVLMLRMAIALPIYLGILIYLTQQKPITTTLIKKHFPLIILLGFIGYFLASWLDLKALEYISAGLERLTLFTYPIFVAIFGALFFKTPLNKKIIVALLTCYLGLWLAFHQELETNQSADTSTGVLLVLLSAFSFSFYVLLSKNVILKIGSLWFTSIAMTISSIFVLLFYALFIDFNTLSVSLSAWFWIICLALFSTVLPSFMISEALAKIGPAQTGIVGTLGPIITIILAIFILDEAFSTNYALGIFFVVSGVLYLTKSSK
ncbi:MAG: DMT family transporter [Gammaproteobacteria bacterium]|nr:DMT family transporter [Gammaproteobacteria bacterium]